jgi:hypothetical protein
MLMQHIAAAYSILFLQAAQKQHRRTNKQEQPFAVQLLHMITGGC